MTKSWTHSINKRDVVKGSYSCYLWVLLHTFVSFTITNESSGVKRRVAEKGTNQQVLGYSMRRNGRQNLAQSHGFRHALAIQFSITPVLQRILTPVFLSFTQKIWKRVPEPNFINSHPASRLSIGLQRRQVSSHWAWHQLADCSDLIAGFWIIPEGQALLFGDL